MSGIRDATYARIKRSVMSSAFPMSISPRSIGLARFDGELLAELRAGVIAQSCCRRCVHCARDQCRQRKLPLVVGNQAVPIMERVESDDEILIGCQGIVAGLIAG